MAFSARRKEKKKEFVKLSNCIGSFKIFNAVAFGLEKVNKSSRNLFSYRWNNCSLTCA